MFKPKVVGTNQVACRGLGTERESSRPHHSVSLEMDTVTAVIQSFSNGSTRILCPYAKPLGLDTGLQYCGAIDVIMKSYDERRSRLELHPTANICVYSKP